MNKNRMMVFTVSDDDNAEKPIGFCKIVSAEVLRNQKMAEKLVEEWANDVPDDLEFSIEKLAHDLRKNCCVWDSLRFCLELSEIAG